MKTENQQQGSRARRFVLGWADWVIRWRWFVLLGTILVAMFVASGGMPQFNSDYHVFFSDENPQLQAYDALQNKYTKDDNVFIVIEPKDGNVFTRETLHALEQLTTESWQTPYSSRVDGITNFQHTRAEGDDLYVEDLVQGAIDKSDTEISRIREITINEPLLKNRLINEDGSVTAINITVKMPGENIEEGNEIIAHVRKMTEAFEANHPGLKTHLSGMIMLSGAFYESSQKDMGTLVPLMFLIVILTILITTRTISGTVSTLLVIIMSIMAGIGFAGWAGIQMTPPSASAMTMILTLAVADSIHILITLVQHMRAGHSKREAIRESIRVNFMPVMITSLTTVIGFLTMNFSDSPPFHDLGNITAVGMTAAFIFSVSTLPALMAILPVKVKVKTTDTETKSPIMRRIAEFVIAHNKKLLWLSSATIIGVSALVVNNELDDQFVGYFDESIKFRRDTDFISENLSGIYNVEFSLGSGESGGINNPEYLKTLQEFEDWLYEQDEVIHVNTFAEVARRINKSMHGDSLAYYAVPGNREEAAQFLLLYEMSLPFGLDLNNQVNVDKSETRFTITLENISSTSLIEFSERAESWLKENAPETMFANGTSTTVMFSHLSQRQIFSMMSGTALAIGLISIILIIALRSFKYGLLSLIPNIAPVAVGFGVWGVTSGVINSGIAIVFGMTLGIIVDDTVHFLSKYLRARREHGSDSEDAVRYAFDTVGRALFVTTIVLVSGFIVMAQSSFGLNSGMAKVTALIIVLALVIDFLMLPALLINISGKEKKQPQVSTGELAMAKASYSSTNN
ncbi:MMPL family transporter [Fulvivirgaceae bacterium BMA10]|uniref:MMPL family transporter n=1 Tax=Splendidivirga corallicola TaxID=3051826 RepID=A0ABT8KMC8_9BACT|nr:MMPL family transporter [Fulvivirgaceae bacterium BMA10]